MLLLSIALVTAPSEAGLVACWHFDGCSTTDASGHALDLTASGSPSCVGGPSGDAWLLNGTAQYLDRTASPSFEPGERAWSVAAWVKTTEAPSYAVILEWYRCGANPTCNVVDAAYYILSLNSGHPCWDIRDDAALETTVEDSSSSVADGTWHFLTGTMNPATDSTKLYVDGALRGTRSGAIGTFHSGGIGIPLEVGRHFRTGWDVPGYYYPGAIDEVRIYDEELSAAAVASLFTHNAITAVPRGGASGLSIAGTWPNPARGGRMTVAFTLPASEPARLTLFDVSGREVSRLPVGALGAGRHQVELGAFRRLAPGVYLIQLTQGTRLETRLVTILE
jgi:hypothetical protein